MFAFLLLFGVLHGPSDGAFAQGRMTHNEYSIKTEMEETIKKQKPAIEAYEEICTKLNIYDFSDPNYPNYPVEYGGAYYEEGFLVLCLTTDEEAIRQTYLDMTSNPYIIRFRTVKHAYDDGYTLLGMTKVTITDTSPGNHAGRGDSGGPIFVGSTLYGIHSGSNARYNAAGVLIQDATVLYFSPISCISSVFFTPKLS